MVENANGKLNICKYILNPLKVSQDLHVSIVYTLKITVLDNKNLKKNATTILSLKESKTIMLSAGEFERQFKKE